MSGGRGGVPGFSPSKDKEDRRFSGGGGWTSHGDYMRDKESKLEVQYARSVPKQSDCLRGVVLHLDGVSSSRQLDLSDLVIKHGGQYSQYLHGSVVTHLLVNNLPAAKIAALTAHIAESKRRGRQIFAVRESWLVESAAQGRRLPECDYALAELQDPEQRTLAGFLVRPTALGVRPTALGVRPTAEVAAPEAAEPPAEAVGEEAAAASAQVAAQVPAEAAWEMDVADVDEVMADDVDHLAAARAPAAVNSANAGAAAAPAALFGSVPNMAGSFFSVPNMAAWFVSVRALPDLGDLSTSATVAVEDAMKTKIVGALGAQWPHASRGAYPLIADQVVLLQPLWPTDVSEEALGSLHGSILGNLHGSILGSVHGKARVASSHVELAADMPAAGAAVSPAAVAAEAAEPLLTSAEPLLTSAEPLLTSAEPLLTAVGVGVAADLTTAILAANVAVRTGAKGSVRWIRSSADMQALLMARPVTALLPALRIEECMQLTSEGLRTCGDLMSLGIRALSLRFGQATAEALIKAASSLWPETVPRVASHATWPPCGEIAWPPASQRPSTSQPRHPAQLLHPAQPVHPAHPAQPGAQSSIAHGKRKAVAPPPAALTAQVIP